MVGIPLWTTYLVFKELSYMPMSTKWAFLGLLAGRELVFTVFHNSTGLASSLWFVGAYAAERVGVTC